GGMDIIEDEEGAGIDGLQGEEEGQGGQRPLTAGEQRERLQPLAGSLRQDLDAVIQPVRIRLGFEPQRGAPAFEMLAEEFLEVDGERLNDGPESGIDLLFESL